MQRDSSLNDTICAISSATGVAARMIVRASGQRVRKIYRALVHDQTSDFTDRSATLTDIHFDGLRVPAWVYTFVSPRSATGEDAIEFHIPGNPLLARMLLDELIKLGARQAEPGEFTARAFFNGKLDLAQAEAVASLVSANNEAELNAARKLLAGELARRLRPIMESLGQTLALVEAGIDFADEGISTISTDALQATLDGVAAQLRSLIAHSARLERLAHEPRVVLVGWPNAGKSALLNALSGTKRAVVSDTAGTTRDALSARVVLKRGAVQLIDVAGVEAAGDESSIEQQMQTRTKVAIETADIVLLLRDRTDHRPAPEVDTPVILNVATKGDLPGESLPGEWTVSAVSGIGMDDLRERLDELAFGQAFVGDSLALNARHVAALATASQHLTVAGRWIPTGQLEFIAAEMRVALDQLGSILGVVSPDDILGEVFAKFCIGK